MTTNNKIANENVMLLYNWNEPFRINSILLNFELSGQLWNLGPISYPESFGSKVRDLVARRDSGMMSLNIFRTGRLYNAIRQEVR